MANLQRIKDIAERQNVSIRDLAERVGIKENQIHVMCRTNSTKIDTLERIARVLGVPMSEFFDDFSVSVSNVVEGNNNQLNAMGAHNNTLASSDNSYLQEQVKLLQAIIAEKDERIKDLKERIEELKTK